ncbi:hypothetical protein N7532_000186 [Penicillium argentinense]|uniref:NAD(P)-binding domain-containing protein n=1 Tax=Penicillium argentinense TaxID=1131581 RepID=A0A9W9KNK9_9EURO|nr:uncharacterized protein N7532_000186 [Penicillium argentinense]KAJ5112141.1 hypothetical protein N7532_000186 [Penicillium argentinense]
MASAEAIPGVHVLLFGGNGRVARAMTKLMVARSWTVTSVIRNPQQEGDILRLGNKEQPSRLRVIHCDLRTIKTSDEASHLLEQVRPNCIVFAAGSFSNPYEIDRDVAQRIMQASSRADYVRKFLMISFPASRRKPAPWWNQRDIRDYHSESNSYPSVKDAKLQADEYLIAMARQRELRGGPRLQAISLRPSWLLTSPGTGKVKLGKTQALGQLPIGDVASIAVSLLSRNDANGWFDLVQGDVEIDQAVEAVVQNQINCIEGEDLENIYKLAVE